MATNHLYSAPSCQSALKAPRNKRHLLRIVSRFFFLHPSCAVQARTTSRSEGGAQRLPGGATWGCFASKCICMPYNHTVDLHKVQCIGRFVHGLRAEAFAIAPHRTLVGSKGQFVKMTETSLPWPLRSNSVVQSVDCESLNPTRGATQQSVDRESLTPTRGATQQIVDRESLTPTRGATQQSLDRESLTPTRGATQKSVDCESLTPTRGATQKSVDCESPTPTRGATPKRGL